MKKWLNIFSAPIAKNPSFFVSMYILGMVAAVCTVHFEWKQQLYEYSWFELFLWVYLSCAILAVLPKWPSRILKGLFYLIAYTVSVVDVYCFVKFESAINPSILMLVCETDPREAGEFFSSYLSPDIITTNVGWVLLVLAVHILWALFHKVRGCKGRGKRGKGTGNREQGTGNREQVTGDMSCQKETGDTPCHDNSRKRNLLLPITYHLLPKPLLPITYYLLPKLLLPVLLIVSACLSYTNLSQLHALMSKKTIGEVEHKLTEKDRGNQFLPLYRLSFSIFANNLAAKQIDILREVEKTVKVDSCSYTSPDIVLIIGEAYNKHHSQLYGYDRPTTPRQLELVKAGKMVPFTDVVSPWNLTSFVFKHIMSTYSVGDEGDWCDYPLFGEVFRKAGYHVTFLTNEFLYQAKQEVFDFSGGFFLNDPQLSAAQFDSRNKKLHVFDEGLLSDYKSVMERRAHDGDTLQQGNLTIFHLIGQHQDYRIRCPRSKQHFKVEDYADRTDLKKPRWKKNLCNYDNATLYNDSIVTEIIGLFKDKDAIVIYMPDHGEEVHSRELPHFSGRMHSTTIVKRLAREEFEIPFWIYATRKYRASHPEIWKEVKASARKPYMTDALPHLLMYLGGIHCKYYRPELNILSPEYNSKRPRILKHQADYDVIMGNK